MVVPWLLIGGPCVIESLDFTRKWQSKFLLCASAWAFPSYLQIFLDKAAPQFNLRGQTVETGLKILQRVKDEIGVPVLTDIHESYQALW